MYGLKKSSAIKNVFTSFVAIIFMLVVSSNALAGCSNVSNDFKAKKNYRVCSHQAKIENRVYDSTSKVRALLGVYLKTPSRNVRFNWWTGAPNKHFRVGPGSKQTFTLRHTSKNAGRGTRTTHRRWPNAQFKVTCGSGNINLQFVGRVQVNDSIRQVRQRGSRTKRAGKWKRKGRIPNLRWYHLANTYVQPQNQGGPSRCYS